MNLVKKNEKYCVSIFHEKTKNKQIMCWKKNKQMQAIFYSNKMIITLFSLMKNWYMQINVSNFNGKYLLVLNDYCIPSHYPVKEWVNDH